MKKRICITVRMGWVEEIETTESSMIQRKEELTNELGRFVPTDGKFDVDVRAVK